MLITFLALSGCGGNDPGGGDNMGSVTFINLPANYYCEDLYVCTLPSAKRSDAEFFPNVIGLCVDGTPGPNNVKKINSMNWNEDSNQFDYVSSDFTYTGKTSVYALFFDRGVEPAASVEVMFNNVSFNGGHAVIDFTAFNIPETDGSFTLSGIPETHEGKYAFLVGAFGSVSNPTALYGLKDATSITAFKGFPIDDNGTVEIPVFKVSYGDTQFSSYDGSGTVSSLVIIIQDEEDLDYLEYAQKMADYAKALAANPMNPPPYPITGLVYQNVDFVGGKASRAYDEDLWVGPAPNQTPAAGDFDIDATTLTQTSGEVVAVSISPKTGKSTGDITVYYEGITPATSYTKSTTLPQAPGQYAVTFNVAAAPGWNEATGLEAGTLLINDLANQTPVAGDFDIDATTLTQTSGEVVAVSISPKTGKSTGDITVYYEGITPATSYTKSATLPQAPGQYAVTFNVAAAPGWNEATGLEAGTLIITGTPIAGDFDIDATTLTQTSGEVVAVSISPKTGKSTGDITVYYEGITPATSYTKSATLPQAPGQYAVTFNVAAAPGWNGATGLEAGTLTINAPPNYTVSFDGNGYINGTAPTPITRDYGTPITIPGNGSLVKPGYAFNGWDTKLNGTGDRYQAGDTYNAYVTVTLYAQWRVLNTYTVTFNTYNGIANTTQTVTEGATVTRPYTNPSNPDYGTFDNWYSTPERTGIPYDFDTPVTGNITLHAKWTARYAIGQTGPGGGKIFYQSDVGFTMIEYYSTAHYLEAAPTDITTPSTLLTWGVDTFGTVTHQAIGGGRHNTRHILANIDMNAPAAKACDQLVSGGKTDWFLPSLNELAELYKAKSIFSNWGKTGDANLYWSSSVEYSGRKTWVTVFERSTANIGAPGVNAYWERNKAISVRAIRAF